MNRPLPSASRPRWMNDGESETCIKCKDEFTLFNRIHHCRVCGGIFCNECSGNWVYLRPEQTAALNQPTDCREPQRCCHDCRISLPANANNHTSRPQVPSASNRSWTEIDCLEYVPNTPFKRYAVLVPTDIRRGQVFQCSLDSRIMTVCLPQSVSPGESLLVKAPRPDPSPAHPPSIPTPSSSSPPTACSTCTYENDSTASLCAMCSSPLRSATGPCRVLELSPVEPYAEHRIPVPPGVVEHDVFQVILGRHSRAYSIICPSSVPHDRSIIVHAPADVARDDDDDDDGDSSNVLVASAVILQSSATPASAVEFNSSDDGTDDSASPELFPAGGRELIGLPRECPAAYSDEPAPDAEEAIRQSLLLTQQFPLQHLHYILASDTDSGHSLADDGTVTEFRASLVGHSPIASRASESDSRVLDSQSELVARRKQFLEAAAEPLPAHTIPKPAARSGSAASPTASLPQASLWASPVHPTPSSRACPACTFVNTTLAILCAVCESPLPDVGPAGASIPVKPKCKTPSMDTLLLAEAEPFLHCSTCTLENAPSTLRCTLCDTPLSSQRPSVDAARASITVQRRSSDPLQFVEVVGSEKVGR